MAKADDGFHFIDWPHATEGRKRESLSKDLPNISWSWQRNPFCWSVQRWRTFESVILSQSKKEFQARIMS
jgi:RIO-like serine/threonine protein kinase